MYHYRRHIPPMYQALNVWEPSSDCVRRAPKYFVPWSMVVKDSSGNGSSVRWRCLSRTMRRLHKPTVVIAFLAFRDVLDVTYNYE